MPVQISENSAGTFELPMMMFVRLADSDGKMTVAEMEQFDKLIASRDWCRSSLLQSSLARVERDKAALWNKYSRGELRSGVNDVAASLDAILNSLTPPERTDLVRDLLHFCRELTVSAHRGAGVLRRDRSAAAELDALIQLLKRPSCRAAQKPKLETATRVPSRVAGALLAGELVSENLWQGGKLSLNCVQVIDETHDVKTFRFLASPPKLFSHRPGQFLTLEVPLDGRPVRRSYTISASPSRPHLICITVKRFAGGVISKWLHENLRVGSALSADGPFGKFTCIGDDGPYVFISGGSGITPMMAMSRWLCDTAVDSDIDFVHFARSPDDFIFADELRFMSNHLPKFRVHFVSSQAGKDTGRKGPVGRISRELLVALVPDLAKRSMYLCGPLGFMDAARLILEQAGCDMSRLHLEVFGGIPRRNTKAAEAQADKPAKVVFSASNIEVDCTGSDYVLDLAVDRGLEQAFSCRAGQCGSCKVMLLDGAVEHDCTDALSPDDAREGFILSCQARPLGTVVVDL
jgi:ferredoxin-NADP reductase